ncbi:hypothetical protein Pyn_18742 [Prunus yedoensis var. nudiflora]|uniref:Uncharacterized protein n=1 Tax=Prunus yedoensis var. nudiflora TaxID=2094558 RepID=A0A314UK76_PRUYE|nr:hypothetical protein Pyn_02711 [Prunus yedoensis var. nudiflora]PQQ00874.1 hypothetical protein Pyn_18742 [Prunus yedoensis var. nudiflora]
MARLCVTLFLVLLFALVFCIPSFEARRLLTVENNAKGDELSDHLGEHEHHHAVPSKINVEKQLAMTLHQLHSVNADRDRILREAVPSPGVGHN